VFVHNIIRAGLAMAVTLTAVASHPEAHGHDPIAFRPTPERHNDDEPSKFGTPPWMPSSTIVMTAAPGTFLPPNDYTH
jgi:hypothetical protein